MNKTVISYSSCAWGMRMQNYEERSRDLGGKGDMSMGFDCVNQKLGL